MEQKVNVTLYRWAGRSLLWEIRSGCSECDTVVQIVQDLLEGELRGLPVSLEIKNWLDHWLRCLVRGGWHAPLVFLNGKLFCQGRVPHPDELAAAIRGRLKEESPNADILEDSRRAQS